CIAAGAAAQERPAASAEGNAVGWWPFVTQLARSPRWLVGAALMVVGVAAHLVALSAAPLTVVQPLGVSGLLLAVWLAARWRGRPLNRREWLGAAAVTAGLVGLVLSLPRNGDPVSNAPGSMALLCVVTAAASLAALGFAVRSGPRVRAWTLAAAAGACFGVGTAMARVVVHRLPTDLGAAGQWTVAACVALLVGGGFLIQNAFRSGHFGLAYATLLIADPVVAAAVGLLVLGEPAPQNAATTAVAVVSAAVSAVGVIVLAGRTRPKTREEVPATALPQEMKVHQSLKETERVYFDAGRARS
ncbi:MAG: DMT family transporter, partial [Stackebrandtia sp.]